MKSFYKELQNYLDLDMTLQFRRNEGSPGKGRREMESPVKYKQSGSSRPDMLCDLWGGMRSIGMGVDINGRSPRYGTHLGALVKGSR